MREHTVLPGIICIQCFNTSVASPMKYVCMYLCVCVCIYMYVHIFILSHFHRLLRFLLQNYLHF
jgi:hypothetical protein